MSEFRQNHATKEWVIIAPERANRPRIETMAMSQDLIRPQYEKGCPFCAGNEAATGQERLRETEGIRWIVR